MKSLQTENIKTHGSRCSSMKYRCGIKRHGLEFLSTGECTQFLHLEMSGMRGICTYRETRYMSITEKRMGIKKSWIQGFYPDVQGRKI